MAKLLNMKLNYKGKVLDFVREGREVKKKFFIGSNKYLFWQILDQNFPDKHLFVTEKGNQLYMQLPPGAKLSCAKDGNPVDSAYLAQNNILKGTELQLRQDMTGTVAIAPDWEISYEFKEPWVNVLTPEEKQIVAQYARFSEPTAMERFNRNLLLLFVLLTIVFILIFDLALKPKESFDATLEQKLATMQKAEMVRAEVAKIEGSTFEDSGTKEQDITPEVPTTPQATQGTPGGATTGGAAVSAGAMFGLGNFDPNATSSSAPTIRVATLTEGFAASRPGSAGGGSGPGQGGGGPGQGGFTSSFNPNNTVGFSSDLGTVATNAPSVGGSSIRPKEGTFVNVAGNLKTLAPSGVAFGLTPGASQLVSSFKSKNVAQVSESNIESMAPETRSRYDVINASVKARQSQIAAIYSKYNQIMPFSGSASIRLLINANGRVQSAIITPNGQMPQEFLAELKQHCEGWTFNVKDESDFTFVAKFRKG